MFHSAAFIMWLCGLGLDSLCKLLFVECNIVYSNPKRLRIIIFKIMAKLPLSMPNVSVYTCISSLLMYMYPTTLSGAHRARSSSTTLGKLTTVVLEPVLAKAKYVYYHSVTVLLPVFICLTKFHPVCQVLSNKTNETG